MNSLDYYSLILNNPPSAPDQIRKTMAYTVTLHQIEDLAKGDAKNEILLDTKRNTELHITVKEDKTIITFPYGNKFDVVDGCIIIYDKN